MTWMDESYKLLLNPKKSVSAPKPHKSLALIDLKKYPMERINVAKENPGIVNRIQLAMQHWFDGMSLKVLASGEETEATLMGKETLLGSLILSRGEHTLIIEVSAMDQKASPKSKQLSTITLERQ